MMMLVAHDVMRRPYSKTPSNLPSAPLIRNALLDAPRSIFRVSAKKQPFYQGTFRAHVY